MKILSLKETNSVFGGSDTLQKDGSAKNSTRRSPEGFWTSYEDTCYCCDEHGCQPQWRECHTQGVAHALCAMTCSGTNYRLDQGKKC